MYGASDYQRVDTAQRYARQAIETLSLIGEDTPAYINSVALELATAQLHEATRIVDGFAIADDEERS